MRLAAHRGAVTRCVAGKKASREFVPTAAIELAPSSAIRQWRSMASRTLQRKRPGCWTLLESKGRGGAVAGADDDRPESCGAGAATRPPSVMPIGHRVA